MPFGCKGHKRALPSGGTEVVRAAPRPRNKNGRNAAVFACHLTRNYQA
jgi:hypothetical protein